MLLVCQLLGETLSRFVKLPIPGPVVGLVFIALGLGIWRIWGGDTHGTPIDRVAGTLLGYLSLMFVPAGVGVIQQLPILSTYWWQIIVVVVISTAVTMMATVLTFVGVKHLVSRRA